MRKLLTGTFAALGLMTVLVGSASASDENWLRHGGPGVVVNQGVDTATTAANDAFAYEQNADPVLHRGGPGTVVNQTEDTASIAQSGQYDYVHTGGSSLRRDAQTADISRDEAKEMGPGRVQDAQVQTGQTAQARIGN